MSRRALRGQGLRVSFQAKGPLDALLASNLSFSSLDDENSVILQGMKLLSMSSYIGIIASHQVRMSPSWHEEVRIVWLVVVLSLLLL